MEIACSKNCVTIKNINNFDLGQTFDCGQCFRWQKIGDKYHGVAFGKEIIVFSEKNNIIIENTNEKDFNNTWENYFDLGTNYKCIGEELAEIHPIIKKAYNSYSGIRILKQEPWEALCSFIISQNNNIPRIQKIVSRLCNLFGNKIDIQFSFPSAQTLAQLTENDLAPIKSGFRAKYIIDAAKKIASGKINFEKIKKMPLCDAEKHLTTIRGVGPKVAQCALLYGFHKLEAFPIDVWMKRVMKTFFPDQNPEIFGKFAGVAQQYLYHYSRMHSEQIK